uniref:hypothetical protein n=1 Tax=Puniceibacterium confluentis TaxID=1958944 RepID=UPI0035684F7C
AQIPVDAAPWVYDPASPDWSSATTYGVKRAVQHAGSLWYALQVTQGTTPGSDPAVWQKLVDGIDIALYNALLSDATTEKTEAITARIAAEAAEAGAETALESVLVAAASAGQYLSAAAGLAGTAEGGTFFAVDGAYLQYYSHDAGPVATPIGIRLPLSGAFDALIEVTGTQARTFGEDGRYNRSGVDFAEIGTGRRAIVRHRNGSRIYDIPVFGQVNGVSGVAEPSRWERSLPYSGAAAIIGQNRQRVQSATFVTLIADPGRWIRSGFTAVTIGKNRRVILDLFNAGAGANVPTAPGIQYAPWSDGTDVFTDRLDTGTTVQVSEGGGNNTDPFLQDGRVFWNSDRAGVGPYEPAAIGGRYFSPPDRADEHPVIPLYWLACFGDSTTAGTGGWPAFLDRSDLDPALDWTIPTMNFGRSGNTALGIASRYWAVEVSYTCPIIPGDTSPVVVTESSTCEGNPLETRHDVTGSCHGYVVSDPDADPMTGTLVLLSYDDETGQFSIARYAAGEALPAGKYHFYAQPTALLAGGLNPPPTDPTAPNFQDAILVLLIGRNSSEDPRGVFEVTQKIVAAHKPLSKRMILMPWIHGQDEVIGSVDYNFRKLALSLFRDEWPDNTLDIVPWLQAANDGSPEDLAAIANDVPPPSTMTDNVHPNNTGRAAIARGVIDFCTDKGWR